MLHAVKPPLAMLLVVVIMLAGCAQATGPSAQQPSVSLTEAGENGESEALIASGAGTGGGEAPGQAETGRTTGTTGTGGTRETGGSSGTARGAGSAGSKRAVVLPPEPAQPPESLQALKQELETLLSGLPGTFGLAVVDLTTGEEVAIQPDRVFPAASTYKLPMAMFVLEEVAQGRASLNDLVEFQEEDWQDGSGVLQDTIKKGDKVSVGKLVELAITESDNIAAMMLRRHFGPENFAAYRQRMGETHLYWKDQDGTIYYGATPLAMTRYLMALYRGQGISDPTLVEHLLNLLCRTAWRDRIDGGVPDTVPVAHKIGTLDGVINDVGLVLHPTRPYVMTFYSQGVEYGDGVAIAEYASRRVYAYFSSVAAAD